MVFWYSEVVFCSKNGATLPLHCHSRGDIISGVAPVIRTDGTRLLEPEKLFGKIPRLWRKRCFGHNCLNKSVSVFQLHEMTKRRLRAHRSVHIWAPLYRAEPVLRYTRSPKSVTVRIYSETALARC